MKTHCLQQRGAQCPKVFCSRFSRKKAFLYGDKLMCKPQEARACCPEDDPLSAEGAAGQAAEDFGGRAPRVPWGRIDIVVAAVALWLAGTNTLTFFDGSYDDLLYIRLANSILHGDWLGPYGQLTLARGPAFPIFLALCAWCRVPVNLAAQAVYLAGSLLLSRSAGRVLHSRGSATVLFGLLALDPVVTAAQMSMILREKLYVGATMLVIAAAVRFLPGGEASWPARPKDFAWSGATGLILGAFWLTREEGVWITPALVLIFAYRGVATFHRSAGTFSRLLKHWAIMEAPLIAALALGFAAVLICVASINLHFYGVFRTNDFKDGPFPAAYGAMLRVEPQHFRQYIFLPKDVRDSLYRESAAARELRPSLEGSAGQTWINIGCRQSPIAACDDLQGGWAMFAVRYAAMQAGHYSDAKSTDDFYRRLASEINAACDAGKLRCSRGGGGMLPPLRWSFLSLAVESFWKIIVRTLTFDGVQPGDGVLDPTLFHQFEGGRIVQGFAAPTHSHLADTKLVTGWVDAPAGTDIDILVAPEGGQSRDIADASYMPFYDLSEPELAGQPGTSAKPFQATCTPDCRVLVIKAGSVLLDAAASKMPLGRTALPDDVSISINVRSVEGGRAIANLPQFVSRVVAFVYQSLCPILGCLAFFGTLGMFAFDVTRKCLRQDTMLASVLLLALLTRTALLAIADATTTPTLELRFLAPGMAVFLALAGFVIAALRRRKEGLPF